MRAINDKHKIIKTQHRYMCILNRTGTSIVLTSSTFTGAFFTRDDALLYDDMCEMDCFI